MHIEDLFGTWQRATRLVAGWFGVTRGTGNGLREGPVPLRSQVWRRGRRWLWLACIVFLVSMAIVQDNPLLIVPAGGLAVFFLGAAWWAARVLPHLDGAVRFSTIQTFLGDLMTMELRLQSHWPFPQPAVVVEYDLPKALEVMDGIVLPHSRAGWQTLTIWQTLWPGHHVVWQHRIFCARRGIFALPAPTVAAGDPLFLRTSLGRLTDAPRRMVVFPLIVQLVDLHLPATHPFGDLKTPRPLLEDPLRMAGIRDYQVGDDPRRIHWKASARAGALRSKVFDSGGQYRFLIALDVNADDERRRGVDSDLLELAITTTASLAYWALDAGYATGMLANATVLDDAEADESRPQIATDPSVGPQPQAYGPTPDPLWLPPARSHGQRERILLALARITPQFGMGIEGILAGHRQEYGPGTTLVLVSAVRALRAETIEYLMDLRRAAVTVYLVLTGYAGVPFPTPVYDLPYYIIGGREEWHAIIDAVQERRRNGSGPAQGQPPTDGQPRDPSPAAVSLTWERTIRLG